VLKKKSPSQIQKAPFTSARSLPKCSEWLINPNIIGTRIKRYGPLKPPPPAGFVPFYSSLYRLKFPSSLKSRHSAFSSFILRSSYSIAYFPWIISSKSMISGKSFRTSLSRFKLPNDTIFVIQNNAVFGLIFSWRSWSTLGVGNQRFNS